MKKEEFEKFYAKNSDVTVEWLRKNNQIAVSCDCRDKLCKGWKMIKDICQGP